MKNASDCCYRTVEITFATKNELNAFCRSLICDEDEGKSDEDMTEGISAKEWKGAETIHLHDLREYTILGAEDFAENKYYPKGYIPLDKVPNREQFIGKRMYIGIDPYDKDSSDLKCAIFNRALELSKGIETFTFRECMFDFDDETFEGYGYR